MSDWTLRIKSRMKELDMTQEMLASKMSITRGAITHYLSGRRVPPLKQFQKLAAILKVDPAWLQYGTTNSKETVKNDNKKEKSERTYPIPLLAWDQVADFIKGKIPVNQKQEFVSHFFIDNLNCFALKVKGDAMTTPGSGKSFYEEEIIIIDSSQVAAHGDYIIALLPHTKELTFKQYVIDGGVSYLKPLNPQYPLSTIEKGTKIIGIIKNKISYF